MDILAQCNRPNPTLAYTSSLGFSRLYILILRFIVTHTGYCTTLLHNKNVALKRLLCGCRSTRLNHVTFIFSVFLFYASSSTSTLAYTTWYNTSCQRFWKKKILSMCVHKENFQFAPKYLILAPSFQKSYKLAHEIQSICSILSLLPNCPKNNYNNLWIITKK